MKQLVFVGVVMALAGYVQVGHYNDVVRIPAPAGPEGYWRSRGPQSEMMSPDTIASLIIAKEGGTFGCRQWQHAIAQPDKPMNRDSQIYNVTAPLDVYPIEHEDNTLSYNHMTLTHIKRLTSECEEAWVRARTAGAVSARASVR